MAAVHGPLARAALALLALASGGIPTVGDGGSSGGGGGSGGGLTDEEMVDLLSLHAPLATWLSRDRG